MNFLIQSDKIDLSYVQEKIEMNKRKELLEKHPYKIWEGKDGKWYTYIPDEEKGRLLKKKTTKKSIEDDVIKFWEAKLENPTVKEVFEEWNDRKLELKKIVPSTHWRNKKFFERHYSDFGNNRIKSLKGEDFSEFLEEQIPKYELTAKAFSNLKTITRGFLKRAKKRRLISFNVEEIFQELDTSDTDFKKIIKEDYEEVFDEKETHIMMEYLENNLDIVNLGILLMFVTGIRIGELSALKKEDFEKNYIKIRRTETRYYDGGHYICKIKEFPKTQAGVRTVIIPNGYLWIINKILYLNPESEYAFSKGKRRITSEAIRKRQHRLCEKLSIYPKSPHKIRKTYGTILLDNHIDNRLIIGQMGHTDILCTENYYHRNRRSEEMKGEILSAIPEFCVK